MSRAGAEFRTPSGELVGRGVYDGTSDVLEPQICETDAEAWQVSDGTEFHSDASAWDALKRCNHPPEVVYVSSFYGGGRWWPVRVCRRCGVAHGPLDWDAIYDELGPEWPKPGEAPIDASAEQI